MNQALVWLRRDLRLHDHAALHHALRTYQKVWLCFIFDTNILEPLLKKGLGFDRRVDFLWQSAHELNQNLRSQEGGLLVRHGDPKELIPKLAEQLQVDCVLSNHDYEPSAIQRDQSVATILAKKNIQFEHFKDQVIFEKTEVLTNSQTVFSVFTPYKNAWLKRLTPADVEPYSCEPGSKGLIGNVAPIPKILDQALPTLESM